MWHVLLEVENGGGFVSQSRDSDVVEMEKVVLVSCVVPLDVGELAVVANVVVCEATVQ